MITKKRMPPLVMDEVLLLVDSYYEIQGKTRSERRETEEELSLAMKNLPFFPDLREYDYFRSVSGMDMLINNIIYRDKENYKFIHVSAKEKKVLDYYDNKRTLLHTYAKIIKELSKLEFPILDDFSDCVSGAMIPSYHIFLEKNNPIIKKSLREAILQHHTKCHVCGMDLDSLYGIYSQTLIEMHIDLPLKENNVRLNPSPSDLILICPTCHKLAHTEPQCFETKQFQPIIGTRQ